MALTILLLMCLGWYISGVVGCYLIFMANRDWDYLTRFQVFWIFVLWAWLGPIMWVIALIMFLLDIKVSPNYWHTSVYRKNKRYRED